MLKPMFRAQHFFPLIAAGILLCHPAMATSPVQDSELQEYPTEEASGLTPAAGSMEDIVVPGEPADSASDPARDPNKAPRLLSGILSREIASHGPAYPIKLRSPEGQLIAYIDLSKIFIEDLEPLLNEKVYIQGQIYPIKPNSHQLVMVAQSIELAE